ncbi:GNAT family N-acetyltransferase [Flexibacterium corallicola]|uniref:GNAT family N-acetyltransferase n=1 Tax=Flexibacterium corallicola TaxID=3037259 RepID=UPI00286F5DF8|nr:GNAT family N-acetyltransferase [Pseudovibrio sp. M1P-2-3]
MQGAQSLSLRTVSSLSQISKTQWNALANPGWILENAACPIFQGGQASQDTAEFNPFVSYEFLSALEDSRCTGEETGWIPNHLLLEDGDQLLAAVPTYLKLHSQGEYVFDHAWAEAIYSAGGSYYPKVQCSVPFTPVTGPRLLIGPNIEQQEAISLLLRGLTGLCQHTGSSSVHFTFLPKAQWHALGDLGLLKRTDQQFHWQNAKYTSFEDFLKALSARKRKAIKKERKEALSAGIEVEWLTGPELTEAHWDAFYGFYIDTGHRKWGTPYLTREFFSLLSERMAASTLLIMAKREGRYIAGALNMIGSKTLYGRNWGCIEDHPCLHFEICYYQAIEFALSRGLQRVEAGAQGAHKLARGYLPSTTYSAHWIEHPGLRSAVEHYLDEERNMVERDKTVLEGHSPFKNCAPVDTSS